MLVDEDLGAGPGAWLLTYQGGLAGGVVVADTRENRWPESGDDAPLGARAAMRS